MSRPARHTAAEVAAIATDALDVEIVDATYLAVGWGNQNWQATDVDGRRYVVKFGPPESGPKWKATSQAYAAGAALGLRAPELLHFGAAPDGWVLRILRWIEGCSPVRPTESFFVELGRAVRALHGCATDGFSSRLDGSAPTFDRWDDYLAHRMVAVAERCRSCRAFSAGELDALVWEIETLAADVAGDATPAVCHRDLYLGNLLSTDPSDEHLAAILDFDGAEAWDPPIDVVKLRWLVAEQHPHALDAFADGYGPTTPHWDERVRLAELVELTNAVANAVLTKDPDFERSARARLSQIR